MTPKQKEAAAILIRQAAAMVDGASALIQSGSLYGEDDAYDHEADRALRLLRCAASDLERAEANCK